MHIKILRVGKFYPAYDATSQKQKQQDFTVIAEDITLEPSEFMELLHLIGYKA